MWHCLLGSHQPAEVWVGELDVAPRDAPHPVREASVLSRTLHGCRFAKRLFHVDRPWRQSLRSRIIAADSGTRLFQFALRAMLWYALCRRSLAGRMALVRATPWPITVASFWTGTQPCCLKRSNRQSMLCHSTWDLRGGTLNEGGPVVLMRRPRNSLDWLGIRLDLPAQLVEDLEHICLALPPEGHVGLVRGENGDMEEPVLEVDLFHVVSFLEERSQQC